VLRGLLVNVLVAVTSTIIFLIGLEGACRLIGFQARGTWSSPAYDHAPDIGYQFKPNYRGTMYKGLATDWREIPVRINAHGLRGPDFPIEKPAGVTRILVLGDSYAFGYMLAEEESFPSILQRMLDERYGSGRMHVINSGTPGYGVPRELDFLTHRGLKLAPDLVVLEASPSDIADAASVGLPEEGGKGGGGGWRRLRVATARNTALATAIQWAFFWFVQRFDVQLSLTTGLHAEQPEPAVQKAWNHYAAEFARLVKTAREAGVPVLLVTVPAKITAFSDNTAISRRWKALAAEHDLPVLDLLPAFRTERQRGLFIPADGHPNGPANEIIARETAAWITAWAARRASDQRRTGLAPQSVTTHQVVDRVASPPG
jgi:lysophospholipase L1-like esterase